MKRTCFSKDKNTYENFKHGVPSDQLKINYLRMKCLHVISLFLLSGIILFSGCKKKTTDPVPETITVSSSITTNTTWSASKTYIIEGEVDIDNCTLTIEPGTTIKFNTGGSIYFGYYGNCTLIANGTADKPIKFTSNASSPTAGAWTGLIFSSYALSNSSMTYCIVEYAGTNDNAAIRLMDCSIKMNNCTVKNAKFTGIDCSSTVNHGFVEFANNNLNTCGSYPLVMTANGLRTLGEGNNISGSGIFVGGGRYNETSGTWKKMTVPYIISGEIDIDGNLIIEAGATFKFNASSSIYVGYYNTTTLTANGTATDKITFTTAATTPASGAWEGLFFYGYTSSTTKLNYCDVLYGGYNGGGYDANIYITNVTGMTISNCDISYSKGWGIYMNNSSLSATSTGNTFSGTNVLGNIFP